MVINDVLYFISASDRLITAFSSFQGTESYDASGEYTTESEVDTSLTSEERNLHSSMDMSTSTCTVTPTHHAKVNK